MEADGWRVTRTASERREDGDPDRYTRSRGRPDLAKADAVAAEDLMPAPAAPQAEELGAARAARIMARH